MRISFWTESGATRNITERKYTQFYKLRMLHGPAFVRFGGMNDRRNLLTCISLFGNSRMAIDVQTDRLSLVFAALADPTRRAILTRLASGDADVSELMKPFDLRQP